MGETSGKTTEVKLEVELKSKKIVEKVHNTKLFKKTYLFVFVM